jgi:shikimate kinase
MTLTAADKNRNLVLIGYRACGKSSVGAGLARRLGRPFVDLDEVLVEEAGQSIAEVVAQYGWPEFRRREKELVERYARQRGLVVAPGGGVVLDPDNVKALKEHGLIIWLTAAPDVIKSRLQTDREKENSRPSLTGLDTLSEVDRVVRERDPLYRAAAQITIDTTGLSIPEVMAQILARVENFPDPCRQGNS